MIDYTPPGIKTIRFEVQGIPRPGGSKKAFSYKGKDGKYHAALTEDNKKSLPWKDSIIAAVNAAVTEQGWQKAFEPVAISVDFIMPRPKGHWSAKGGLKKTAQRYHSVKPDVDKLIRSLFDAITESGVVWLDDSKCVTGQFNKLYSDFTGWTGARVKIELLGDEKIKQPKEAPNGTERSDLEVGKEAPAGEGD